MISCSNAGEPTRRPRYQAIASSVGQLIERGVLRPGDRIPSLRRASRQHGVSVTTATQAYLELENRGFVEARPKSGYFVRFRKLERLLEPETSQPARQLLSEEGRSLFARLSDAPSRPATVPFGVGVPSSALLPVRKLNRMVASAARAAGAVALEYDTAPGCAKLRRMLVRRALDWGVKTSPEEILTTNGCMEALVLALRAVTHPGDAVAIESPTYFGIVKLLEQLGLKGIEIPTHPRRGLDLDALETILKCRRISACVVVANFNNPLGSLMPMAAKERLVEMLRRREIPLIEDDIYGDLHFENERPHAAKRFDKDGLVMLCGSFSKTLAPGYRVGWLLPGRFLEETTALKATNSGPTATIPQLAIAEYVQNGGYERHLRSLRLALRRQVDQVSEAVADAFPRGTKMTRPAGGFLLWLELPRHVDAMRLHHRALAEKISIVPGPMFSPRHGFQNFIRLSCGYAWSPPLERAIAVLGDLVKRQQ